jgi:hypothetical protein
MKTKIYHFGEVRVVEEGREGSTVFVRPLGEQEVDTGKTVEYDPKHEQLVLTTPIYAVSLNATSEIGCKNDMLTWIRVVPDGRDGSIVYCRPLLPDELDTGLAVQRRPGDTLVPRQDSRAFSFDSIDRSVAIKFEDGYASIANTVWTWLFVYPAFTNQVLSDDMFRFLLSTARRLDATYKTFSLLHSKLKELETVENGIQQRNLTSEIIGLVEIAIIAMNRAFQMAEQLGNRFSISTPFPTLVKDKLEAIKNMRNAYEHIDSRAFGRVGQNSKLHTDALSVFNFERLFQEGIATYGRYELDIYNEAIQLLVDTRKYLKEATSELAPDTR